MTRQNNPKLAVLGQNHVLRENFQNSSVRVEWRTMMCVLPEFHANLSHYKENNFISPVTKKTPTFFAAILCCFDPGHQNFNMPTYACKTLSASVKVCQSYSQ